MKKNKTTEEEKKGETDDDDDDVVYSDVTVKSKQGKICRVKPQLTQISSFVEKLDLWQ